MQGGSLLIMLVLMVGLMYFMSRSQKKQYQKRMESLNKLQKEMKSSRLVACTELLMKSIQNARRLSWMLMVST